MKRAQGLPITTIIIAALALIVLIVLIGIFGFRAQKFGAGVTNITEGDVCPGPVISISACASPVYGNFVQSNGQPIPSNMICCSS